MKTHLSDTLNPKLQDYIDQQISGFESIPSDRKTTLTEVAEFIQESMQTFGIAKLNFICTHNSRRSHLSQIWTQVAAYYFKLESIQTFSGGTEATEFNPRAVEALKRAGFIIKKSGGKNPKYQLQFSKYEDPIVCFSKRFDDPINPTNQFAAIMTCDDADQNCPVVNGTSYRKSVTYIDPKISDNTTSETQTYDARCQQIATEMFYMISKVKSKILFQP